jgi:lactosylceramide 4-alpha-galactosyltransferase
MFSLFSLFSISVLLLNVYNQDISKYSVRLFNGIPSKYNIFMVETNTESDYLNFNQLCSVESNALHNPQATLNLLSLRAKINQTILFEKYPNIKWSLMSEEDIFEDTPLKEWWEKGKLTNVDKYFRYSHLSDALRLALVYKNGGFYSDLDHIALRNFEPLTKYSALVNRPKKRISVESSFFHIKQHHGYLKVAMDDYAKNYDPDQWV